MAGVSKNKNILIGVLVIGILAAASFGVYRSTSSRNDVDAVVNTDGSNVVQQDIPSGVSVVYKDGQYSAAGSYTAPDGQQSVLVNLTLKDDIVTVVAVEGQATKPASKRFQNMFIQNFQSEVVGKNINEIELKKVSGSSLTPKGFNDALSKIKTQAVQS